MRYFGSVKTQGSDMLCVQRSKIDKRKALKTRSLVLTLIPTTFSCCGEVISIRSKYFFVALQSGCSIVLDCILHLLGSFCLRHASRQVVSSY